MPTAPRRALVTGITGQDGSYLAELLESEGRGVIGMVAPGHGAHVPYECVEADLRDYGSLRKAVETVRPQELYHLAAPTFVPDSWDDPSETIVAIAGATSALLAASRGVDPAMRIWVATSSEIFGDCDESPQHERSPMRPRTPYGVAKLAAHGIVRTMRERHGMFVCSGILYNHESPRRPERFVSRKVTRAAAAIKLGLRDEVVLGDLDAVRDWSHAADVVRAALLALEHDQPDDYVIASGVGHTVGDLVAAAFGYLGLDPDRHVRVDPALVRPPEAIAPIGNPARARAVLGWEPQRSFDELVREMVDADLESLRSGAAAGA